MEGGRREGGDTTLSSPNLKDHHDKTLRNRERMSTLTASFVGKQLPVWVIRRK